MSSLMLSDLTNVLNAAGNMAGSFAQLYQTRVAVETNKRSLEIQKRQQDFLKRQYLMPRDPNRLDLSNWESEIQGFESEIESYLGELSDDNIRAGVQANLQNNAEQFTMDLLRTYSSMAIADTQQTRMQSYQDQFQLGKGEEAITTFRQDVQDGLWSPGQATKIKAEFFRPIIAQSNATGARQQVEQEIAKTGVSRNINLGGIELLSRTDDPETPEIEGPTTIDTITGEERPLNDIERKMAIDILNEQQAATNDAFVKDIWENKNDIESPNSYTQFTAQYEGQLTGFAAVADIKMYSDLVKETLIDYAEGNSATWLAQQKTRYGNGISFGQAGVLKQQANEFTMNQMNSYLRSINSDIVIENSDPLTWIGISEVHEFIDNHSQTLTTIDQWKRSSTEEGSATDAEWKAYLDDQLFLMLVGTQDASGRTTLTHNQAVTNVKNLIEQCRTKFPQVSTWAMHTAYPKIVDFILGPQEGDRQVVGDKMVTALNVVGGEFGKAVMKAADDNPSNLVSRLLVSNPDLGVLLLDAQSLIQERSMSAKPEEMNGIIDEVITSMNDIYKRDIVLKIPQDSLSKLGIDSKEFLSAYEYSENNPELSLADISATRHFAGDIPGVIKTQLVDRLIEGRKLTVPDGNGGQAEITRGEMQYVTLVPINNGTDFLVKVAVPGKPQYVFAVNHGSDGLMLTRAKVTMGALGGRVQDFEGKTPAEQLQLLSNESLTTNAAPRTTATIAPAPKPESFNLAPHAQSIRSTSTNGLMESVRAGMSELEKYRSALGAYPDDRTNFEQGIDLFRAIRERVATAPSGTFSAAITTSLNNLAIVFGGDGGTATSTAPARDGMISQ